LSWLDKKTTAVPTENTQPSVESAPEEKTGEPEAGLREQMKEILKPLLGNRGTGLKVVKSSAEGEKPATPAIEFPPPRHFENAGQLLTAASRELHLTRAEATAGKINMKDVKDLDEVWKQLTTSPSASLSS
jgi:hypothetical protein